jgi:RecA-family ATPase
VVDGIRAEIVAKAIDVLQIDPFVASHTVAENDNTKIALVARQWAAIAEETGCAVELVHHVRKLGNGSTVLTVEDARGASALIAAVRSARVINAGTAGRIGEVRLSCLYSLPISASGTHARPGQRRLRTALSAIT